MRRSTPRCQTAVSLAFRKLAEESPAAADLIRLYALKVPDAIPEEVITSMCERPLERRRLVQTESWRLVKASKQYSLIERHRAIKTLEVHRLLQDVVREEHGGADAAALGRVCRESGVERVSKPL